MLPWMVALRDINLNEVLALGFGVHTGPGRFLLPAGADVAVGCHALFLRLLEQRGLFLEAWPVPGESLSSTDGGSAA